MILAAKTVITGDGKTVLRDAGVRVGAEGTIGGVGPLDELARRFPGEEVRDYGDATIVPGLIDMHVHLGYWWSAPDAAQYDARMESYLALKQAREALENGVTTIRDACSTDGCCEMLRRAGRKGFFTLPRLIHCGPGLCMTGGHGWELSGGCVEVDGAQNLRAAIRKNLRDGADFIKILTSHRTHTPEYTQEELDAAVDECHRVGRKIAVHAGTHPAIEMCIQAGFDTIEHGTYLTVAQASEMARRGIAWVPTIIAYTYIYEFFADKADQTGNIVDDAALSDFGYFKDAAQTYKRNFKALLDTGVTVLTGTDMVLWGAPVTPVARELQYMVDYGMKEVEAVRAATGAPADVLGLAEQTGTIREGLQADLLVVRGDVSADIRALAQVREVFLAGQSVHARA